MSFTYLGYDGFWFANAFITSKKFITKFLFIFLLGSNSSLNSYVDIVYSDPMALAAIFLSNEILYFTFLSIITQKIFF